MDRSLLKLLLDHAFWQAHKGSVSPSMFEGEARPLYEAIAEGHARYGHDLTATEVASLLRTTHPTLPRAARNAAHEILADLADMPALSEDVAADVLATAYRLQTFRQIAELAIAGSTGSVPDLEGIRTIIERCGEGFAPTSDFEVIPSDLDEILDAVSDTVRWRFNIPTLAEKLPGMSGGELLLFLARPETGKSAAPISLACAPGGWCWQGAKVAIFVNEEPGLRTKLRAVTAAVGKPAKWVREHRDESKLVWDQIADRFTILDGDPSHMTMTRIDAYCRIHKPDIVVLDQLDKVRVSKEFEAGHERLREVYTQARELAKRHKILVVGIGQASIEAEGKSVVTPSMAEGSKTGKFAEADVIVGIGKNAQGQSYDQGQDFTRHWNIGKNKITGWCGQVITMLNPATSTYGA